MRSMKSIGVALLAVFALSAVVAVAAQGTEGPYWKVGGARLAAGQTTGVLSEAKKAFTLFNPVAKVKIECKALKLGAGSTLNGSSGANAGTSKEVIEYSECKGGGKEESLTECEPVGNKITTEPVTNTLGYSKDEKLTSLVLVLFKPVTGGTFVTINFTGKNCFASSTAVTGTVIGEPQVNGQPIEVDHEPAPTAHGVLVFTPAKRTILVETGGKLTTTTSGLTAFGTASTLEGEALVFLHGLVPWAILTR